MEDGREKKKMIGSGNGKEKGVEKRKSCFGKKRRREKERRERVREEN